MLAIAALATGRARLFLRDWSIFLIVLLAWQVISGMSRNIGHFKPHVTEMIWFDKVLFFGNVPTIWLQKHLYHPGHLAWYDLGATVLYLMHFVFPMLVAFGLWVWKRPVFLEFMVAFLLLALAGFATYVLFPAAPPWLASNWGYLPPMHRILHSGIAFFGGQMSISSFYSWLWQHGGWDQVGAVPSEHAAIPFLCFLYARKAWSRAGWLLLVYPILVSAAVVYLGEHYVADVVVGVAYGALAYAAVQFAVRRGWTVNAARESEAVIDSIRHKVPA